MLIQHQADAAQTAGYTDIDCTAASTFPKASSVMHLKHENTCEGGDHGLLLYTILSRAYWSTPPGTKQGRAFSPPSSTPAAAARSRTYTQSLQLLMPLTLLLVCVEIGRQDLRVLPCAASLIDCKQGCSPLLLRTSVMTHDDWRNANLRSACTLHTAT